ncbi:uncharacterized protein LACBIDRAFT_328693 [Laccaria bicolor S238N-H82]|uniref:Predicted protein n=1 Tax=Laccaria bicolor (strain S238N-H82 / ATCC MYA-4686) TaxID=486041 RepID=B0DFP7_LACBS|nr:uncharacterized protein LACBIDRAFT_328693 [Laccaria bicolor S238N-H82]EDR06384.1 predicted protein [Laccaria bicolor S238N-H82]|eukprot:XP_001882756.1 predicted protein [Laccaria bicolor S238N-H82]
MTTTSHIQREAGRAMSSSPCAVDTHLADMALNVVALAMQGSGRKEWTWPPNLKINGLYQDCEHHGNGISINVPIVSQWGGLQRRHTLLLHEGALPTVDMLPHDVHLGCCRFHGPSATGLTAIDPHTAPMMQPLTTLTPSFTVVNGAWGPIVYSTVDMSQLHCH